MKDYEVNGFVFQFTEGKQPKNAVEVKKKTVKNKARKPANKKAEPEKENED